MKKTFLGCLFGVFVIGILRSDGTDETDQIG